MTNHLPLVLQLRADSVDPNVPVSKLLRLAKVIATKLDQKDALKWIDKELDGYMDGVAREVPAYRMIGGQPKGYNPYRGWQAILFQDNETEKQFSTVPLGLSIGAIEKDLDSEETRRGSFVFPYPAEVADMLRKAIRMSVEVTVFLSEGSLWVVVEVVRNLVLIWTLELEKAGILGAEMTFTRKEKEQGAAVTQQYFIQNVGVLGNVSDSAKVENAQIATAALDTGKIGDFAREGLALMGQVPADLRPKLAPMLNELRKDEAAKENPDQSTLREMLTSVRTIAEGAAGNLAASGIVTMISKLPGV
jgi:AbiTii-like protein